MAHVSALRGSEKEAMNLSVKSAGRGCSRVTFFRRGLVVCCRRSFSPEPPQAVRSLTKCRTLVRL